jgi:hypothetical protein
MHSKQLGVTVLIVERLGNPIWGKKNFAHLGWYVAVRFKGAITERQQRVADAATVHTRRTIPGAIEVAETMLELMAIG